MDVYAVRTLEHPGSVACAVACRIGNVPSIAVSYGKRIEFYNYEGSLLRTVHCNDFVVQMARVFLPNDACLLLLSKNNDYVILENGEVTDTGCLFQRSIEGIRPLRMLALSTFVMILLSNSRVIFALQKDKSLVFYDKFNYFGSYKIYDVAIRDEKVFFLMEDSENKVVYTYYGLKPTGKDFMHFETGTLPSNTYKVAFFRDSMVLFQHDKVSLYVNNKVVYQTNFANPELNSWVETEDGVLLSMRNGELIRLKISSTISVQRVYDLGFCIDTFMYVGGFYFGGSCTDGRITFTLENDDLRITQQSGSMASPKCVVFNDGLEVVSKKTLYRVKHQVCPKVLRTITFDDPIKRMWVFNSKLIVSFPEKSAIYDLKTGAKIRDFEEIRNAYEYKNFKFNTENLLVETSNGSSFGSVVEWETIILSAYHRDYIVIYAHKKIQLLKSQKLIKERRCTEDIQMVFIHDFILTSTAPRKCIFYNHELDVTKVVDAFEFVGSTIFKHHLILTDKHNTAYVADLESLKSFCEGTKECNVRTMFKQILPRGYPRCCTPHNKLNCLLFTGWRPCAVFMGEEITSFEIAATDVMDFCTYADTRTTEMLLIARKHEILFCEPWLMPETTVDKQMVPENTKFVTVLGTTSRRIVASVEQSKQLASRLAYVDAGTLVDEYVTEGKMVVFARYFSGGFVVAGFNLKTPELCSELVLFDVRSKMSVLCVACSPGLLHSISAHGNTFVTSHGSRMAVYEIKGGAIMKRAETSELVFPFNFVFSPSGKEIFVNDMMRPFCIFRYTRKTASVVERSRRFEEHSSHISEALAGRVFMANVAGHFFICSVRDEKSFFGRFYYGENVLGTCVGHLGPQRRKRIYFATENGSVGMVALETALAQDERELLEYVQEHLRTQRIFKPRHCDGVVDIDLFANIDIEATCRDLSVDALSVKKLVERLGSMF